MQPGTVTAQMVSIQFRVRTTIKLGTIPPVNIMVNAMSMENLFFPVNLLRERGYAVSTVRTSPIKVPTTVYNMVLKYEVQISLFWKIIL